MSLQVTIVNPVLIDGAVAAVGSTPELANALAESLVWRGDATPLNWPTPSVDVNPDVYIDSDQIADATPQGIAILTAGTLDAFLTAIGAQLGAASSGGAGLKAICVPNAST